MKDEEKETDIEYNTFLVYKILILTTNLIKHKITDFQLSYHTIIKQLREKKYTYSQIADYLNERNMKTITNKTWKNSAVHSLMKNVENHLRERFIIDVQVIDSIEGQQYYKLESHVHECWALLTKIFLSYKYYPSWQ